MKIEINNFGPIKHFVFDLDKDFHIVYGKNNIGKSYAISLVYLILKSFREGDLGVIDTLQIRKLDSFIFLFDKIEKLDNGKISITRDYEKIVKEVLSVTEGSFIDILSTELANSFDLNNVRNKFLKKPVSIRIITNAIEIKIGIVQGKLILKNIRYNRNGWQIVKSDENIDFYGREDGKIHYQANLALDSMESNLTGAIVFNIKDDIDFLWIELEKHYSQLYFLPASRSGLYEGMNIFSSLLVQLSQSRHTLTGRVEIPSLPIPTSDYLLNLSTIRKHKPSGVYADFAKKIEQQILKAEVTFNHDNKKLEYYNKDIKLKLDIGETSSMISEVAPIVAHLKYIIGKEEEGNKILFIEEPEAHLHPEVQLALMEVFAELTRHNIKIVMTTHSNYIFNKVNNLILKEAITPDKIGVHHLLLTKEGSVQNPDIFSEDTGMIDENFVDIAEQLYNERLEITD